MTRHELPQVINSAIRDDALDILHCIRNGDDINARGLYGETALHWAAIHGDKKLASILLSGGADIRACDVIGRTPYELARRLKNNAVAEFLRPKQGSRER